MTSPAPLTAAEIAELRTLYDAATSGRWFSQPTTNGVSLKTSDGRSHFNVAHISSWDRQEENGRLIAILRNALPGLLATIAERDARIAELERQRDVFTDGGLKLARKHEELRTLVREYITNPQDPLDPTWFKRAQKALGDA